MLRVREFTQDDAHIICTPDQLNDEIKGVLNFVKDMMGIFDFDYELEVSTRPAKSIGTDADWDLATRLSSAPWRKTVSPMTSTRATGRSTDPRSM